MLADLAPLLDGPKLRDIVERAESKDIGQALPAEMELAVLWAIAQLGPAEIEPYWYGISSLPDAFSEDLVPGVPVIVEVAALSDAALPADEGMRNASRKLSHEAGSIWRGIGRQLSYYFMEETVRIGRESIRRVCVPRDLTLNAYHRAALRQWLHKRDRSDGDKIRLKDGELDVVITWHDRPQSRYNFHTSMPPEIRRLRDNYVHRALDRKAKQLKSPMFDGLKCVVLADVGSTALRRVAERDQTGRVFNGGEIIRAFLQTPNPGIDVVAVIAPNRSRRGLSSLQETIDWNLNLYCRPGLEVETQGFERLLSLLPKPRREGYQTRQLHEQAVFSPTKKGRYMQTSVTWRMGEKSEIRFSARALLDTLAGRQTTERFMEMLGSGSNNFFKTHLDRGETISAIRFESGGLDNDDDQIVVEFKDDPAARPLQNPLSEEPSQEVTVK